MDRSERVEVRDFADPGLGEAVPCDVNDLGAEEG
jgi:hypothetical protein